MMSDRKTQLISCCESIVRNADHILEDCQFTKDVNIKIHLEFGSLPVVEVTKTILPKEVISELNGGDLIDGV